MATDEYEKSGLKFDNIRPTFSSLTLLLGGKSLKIIDLSEIELMPICHLKDILLISGCNFMILGYFLHKNVKDLS